ncbi:hypothetical protein [Paludibacterium yongneupense]|uniref:hypothetical protein n=1 Tax=Paludibacterium yongneupense TaxID=400061 RepID=UPI0004041A1B|nr:hypothetical protein [Paludibacterium yongneupense]
MSAWQIAKRLIEDYADHGRRHPDFFLLGLDVPVSAAEADFIALSVQILDARLSTTANETHERLAETMPEFAMGGASFACLAKRGLNDFLLKPLLYREPIWKIWKSGIRIRMAPGGWHRRGECVPGSRGYGAQRRAAASRPLNPAGSADIGQGA